MAITLFDKRWGYEQNWEFTPVEGGYYVIRLATPPGVAPSVAMARAKNPQPQNPVWALYGDPAAVTESYVGVESQEWLIEHVHAHDEDTHVVTIRPRNALDEVLAVGDAGQGHPPWCSTRLRKAQDYQTSPLAQWRVPVGVGSDGRFSVKPGGNEVHVKRGEVCYPGVEVDAVGDGVVWPQTVVVTLPEGKGLHFTKEGNPHYVLKVQPHGGREKPYPGESEDGKSVTFKDVDLGLSGEGSFSRAWVAVLADHDAPLGETHLSFRVGSQTSNSNLIRVVENHKKQ